MPRRKEAPPLAAKLAALAPGQVDALNGPAREAWYAAVRGDTEKLDAIVAAYSEHAIVLPDAPEPEPAETPEPEPVEVPEG